MTSRKEKKHSFDSLVTAKNLMGVLWLLISYLL